MVKKGERMKKIYQNVEVEILLFDMDIVTLSENAKDNVGEDIFGNNN